MIVSALGWLDRNAVGAACFVGPEGRRFTAVPVTYAGGVRFNLIEPRVYRVQYLPCDAEELPQF